MHKILSPYIDCRASFSKSLPSLEKIEEKTSPVLYRSSSLHDFSLHDLSWIDKKTLLGEGSFCRVYAASVKRLHMRAESSSCAAQSSILKEYAASGKERLALRQLCKEKPIVEMFFEKLQKKTEEAIGILQLLTEKYNKEEHYAYFSFPKFVCTLPRGKEKDYVFEILDAIPLSKKIENPIQKAEAKEILEGLSKCIRYVHTCGIYHRDINLDNILIPDRTKGLPRLFLIDFDNAEDNRKSSKEDPEKRAVCLDCVQLLIVGHKILKACITSSEKEKNAVSRCMINIFNMFFKNEKYEENIENIENIMNEKRIIPEPKSGSSFSSIHLLNELDAYLDYL